MSDREYERMPYRTRLEFRTASSFLVAYSVNLSRGGLFLETEADVPNGQLIGIELNIPKIDPVGLVGTVMWRRAPESPDGPAGLGIEFTDVVPTLGPVIDHLVTAFHGVHILVVSGDRQDRTTLSRLIKSIISTSEIVQAAEASVADSLITGELDLAVVDVDFDGDGGIAAIRAAKAQQPPVPTVAITSSAHMKDLARAAGADEIASNPPPFAELQVMLVRALSKPIGVHHTVPAGSDPKLTPPA
jgi:uncharacterized protein (TIGR02266 family)